MVIKDIDIALLSAEASSRASLWRQFVTLQEARVVAEVGVWKGDFAADLLATVPAIELYYMIDPWANLPDWNKPFNVQPEIFEGIYSEMEVKTRFAAHRRKLLRGRTKEVIDCIPDASLDFAYIDGDHTLRGITIDLIKIWPKVKPGGFIAGDDFTDSPWQHDSSFEPTLVCPLSLYFAEAMDAPFVALRHDQFIIQKNGSGGFSFEDTTGKYSDLSLNKLRKHGT